MRIGIDIDNCISNFDDVLLEEYLKHDKELRNTGIINEKPDYITRGMFDWSKEENDDFYQNNIQRIAMSLKPLNMEWINIAITNNRFNNKNILFMAIKYEIS